MEIPQSKAYEIVGQQQVEIVILREQVRAMAERIRVMEAAKDVAKPVEPVTEKPPAGRSKAK